jgi:hypothetical protein
MPIDIAVNVEPVQAWRTMTLYQAHARAVGDASGGAISFYVQLPRTTDDIFVVRTMSLRGPAESGFNITHNAPWYSEPGFWYPATYSGTTHTEGAATAETMRAMVLCLNTLIWRKGLKAATQPNISCVVLNGTGLTWDWGMFLVRASRDRMDEYLDLAGAR